LSTGAEGREDGEGRVMMSDFQFLDKVTVARFTECKKSFDPSKKCRVRHLIHTDNPNASDCFTVLGTTTLKEGAVMWNYDDTTTFHQTASHKVYIVAKTIGRRKYALPSDMAWVEKETDSRRRG